MSKRIDTDQKESCLEAIKVYGTIKSAAKVVGISPQTIRKEMKRSAIFRRKVEEAMEDSKFEIRDDALTETRKLATPEYNKDVRSRLTANLALLNWVEPGFRGATQVQGRIEHDIRVITAVPRPRYDELPAPGIKVIDNSPKKMLKSKKVEILDKDGNLVAVKHETVEEAIEGEVIKESE